jgi:enamine deaminase RidA (YjgF/YER057c/UK114 family)
VDGVASSSSPDANSVSPEAEWATLPRGSRIYVSGQAEQSESLAEATQATLQSLHKTLEFLGRSDGDIVQLKAFVQPMSDANLVRAEVDRFFAGKPVPPLILVEWKSSKTTPIEIELIAAGGKPGSEAPSMEFLTPPGMTASPVYCRVCCISHPTTIYVSGLFSKHDRASNPDSTVNGEIEVKDQFAQLDRILKLTGSDFRHLAKATYYVSTDSASVSLNKLRPGYYDPQRPPAASKAIVSSVGVKDLGLTIDMIAAPKSAVAAP